MVMEWSFEDSTFNYLSRLNFLAFGVIIVVDCSLTSALVAILRSRRTAFKRTNSMLKSLSLYAIIATAMTTISTIPIDIFLVIQPHNFIWIAMTMPATKVYSNSVLAMLNCRAAIWAGNEDLEAICVPEESQSKLEAHTGDPIVDQPTFSTTTQGPDVNGSARRSD
ncbi:hypothetical protein C8Q74DRAFT_120583 [Fomes fomentarius]|nr:hypothetical protein C8Q74DRAFT_120583 [Fomes fomentarius]